MRKHTILALVFLFLMTFAASAAETVTVIPGTIPEKGPAGNPATFQIKAYRIYEQSAPYCNIVIVSSIPSHLDRVENNAILHIDDNYIEKYMGVVQGSDTQMTSFDEHVVFSYRIEGNTKGNFKLELSFSPFYLNGIKTNDSAKCIQSAYELGSETYSFNSTGNGSDNEGGEIKYTGGRITDGESERDRITLSPEKTSGSFSREWSVSDQSSDGDTVSDWAVRGGIALDIGPTTYAAAEYGTYQSKVTVILTTP